MQSGCNEDALKNAPAFLHILFGKEGGWADFFWGGLPAEHGWQFGIDGGVGVDWTGMDRDGPGWTWLD